MKLALVKRWFLRFADDLQAATLKDLLEGVGLGVLLQLALGAPFLLHKPAAYLSRSFELSR